MMIDKQETIARQVKLLLVVIWQIRLRPSMLKKHLAALEKLDALLDLLLIAKLSDIETYFYTYFKEPSFKVWLLSKLLPAFFSRSSYEKRSHKFILEIQERQTASSLADLKDLLGKSFDFIRLLDMMVLKLLKMLYLLRDSSDKSLNQMYKIMLSRHKKNDLEKLKEKLGTEEYINKMNDIVNNLHLLYSEEEMNSLLIRKEKIKEILMLEPIKEIVDKKLIK